jgi:uncharacterized protein (TIGR02145 family)
MYKINNKLKSIVFSMVVTAGMLLPVGALAQDDAVPHGGLFSYYGWFNSEEEEILGLMRYNEGYGSFNIGTEIFGSDTDGGLNIYTQQFGYEEEETPLGSGCIVLTLAGAAYAIRKRKNNKKTINKMKSTSTFIIAAVLLLGLSQCKKNELPVTPETPEVEGNQVYISVSVNGGSKHIVYPESGVYFFQDGDKLYVGNHGYYVGTLEYSAGVFSGTIEINDTCAAAYRDYLHFYFIGGAYTGTLKTPEDTNPTTSFEWSIADQTGDKLPILSYGHSTQKYSKKATAYSCMLENKCGFLKFRAWPAPSTTTYYDTVKISGMKTTALIDFAHPGITPTDDIGEVKLHHVSGTDAAERWAILLPQEGHVTTVSYYKNNDNPSPFTQTISLPVIKANTYYGGYNGISVGLEYVDLGLSVLWAACNVGSCTHEGYGTFFAWGDPEPKTSYCWSHYPFAEDPDPYDGDTIHFEWDSTIIDAEGHIKLKPNLWLTKYNTQDTWCPESSSCDDKTTLEPIDDAALAIMKNGWRTPTVEEWNELINNTSKERVLVNGIGGIKFTSTKEGYTDKSIFLPFAGFYSGNQHSAQYNGDRLPVGEYWSNQIDSDKPYQAWCLYIDDPTYGTPDPEGSLEHIRVTSGDPTGTDDVGFIRNEGRPVRAVRAR